MHARLLYITLVPYILFMFAVLCSIILASHLYAHLFLHWLVTLLCSAVQCLLCFFSLVYFFTCQLQHPALFYHTQGEGECKYILSPWHMKPCEDVYNWLMSLWLTRKRERKQATLIIIFYVMVQIYDNMTMRIRQMFSLERRLDSLFFTSLMPRIILSTAKDYNKESWVFSFFSFTHSHPSLWWPSYLARFETNHS